MDGAEDRVPKLELLPGGLGETGPTPKKKVKKARSWIAQHWNGIAGVVVLISAIAGALYFYGKKDWATSFNVGINIAHILENVGKDSEIGKMALQNLEKTSGVGKNDLQRLRETIWKVENRCNDCKDLLIRLRKLEKKWEVNLQKNKPVSDLRWKPAKIRVPAAKMQRNLPRRTPGRLARNKC